LNIEAGVKIADDSIIEAGCYIGEKVAIGKNCRLYPNVSVREHCILANRVILHCGVVIGGDGFGYIPNPSAHIKIPQVGIVQLDDDVEIGANTTVDRARFGKTWIKKGTKIDNLVMIGHNVEIGEHCFIVAGVAIAGSAKIGNLVQIGGHSGVNGHLIIGDGATIMANTKVYKDLAPGAQVMGEWAMPHHDFLKSMALYRKLPELNQRIKDLEKKLNNPDID